MRRSRRDRSEVSCCVKYLVFAFNAIFWVVGLGIMGIGLWAWSEKDVLQHLSELTNIALDPAFIFILVGVVTFIMGFAGCIGALRENTCLLLFYAAFLGVLLFMELGIGILAFVYKDWVKEQVTEALQRYIVAYRESYDTDLQNLINWMQGTWLQCCGIDGPDDWDKNIYFNCTSISRGSREACGVPFSCCKEPPDQEIKNWMCGYDVRGPEQRQDWDSVIYTRGCLAAGEEWFMENLMVVAGIAVGIAVLEVMGICFAQNLRADIFAQKAKWRR